MVDMSAGRPCLGTYVAHVAARDGAMAAAVEKRKEREYKAEVRCGVLRVLASGGTDV